MRSVPEKISKEKIDGRTVRRDAAGYLVDPDEWTPEIARRFAIEENIQLNDDHWAVINFMRDYLAEHDIAADARFTFRHLADLHSESIKAARRRFFKLFPYGYPGQACKIAGMRQPRAWSTG